MFCFMTNKVVCKQKTKYFRNFEINQKINKQIDDKITSIMGEKDPFLTSPLNLDANKRHAPGKNQKCHVKQEY